MRRVLVALALVFGSTQVASAGPYLGFGLGPTGTVGNDFTNGAGKSGQLEFNANGRSGRILGGYRFPGLPFIGAISIEAAIAGYGLLGTDNSDYGGRQAMLTGKYSYPLGGGFEVFGRLGLNHAWITSHNTNDSGRSGDGYVLGVGAEYRFKLPMAQASAFIDYSYGTASIDETAFTREYSSRMWTLGFTFGI